MTDLKSFFDMVENNDSVTMTLDEESDSIEFSYKCLDGAKCTVKILFNICDHSINKFTDNNNKTIDISTTNIMTIKNTFNLLNIYASDCRIKFNNSGININRITESKCELLIVNFKKENFEKYNCNSEINAYIDIPSFLNIFKYVSSEHTMNLTMDDNNKCYLYIEFIGDNTNMKHCISLLQDMNKEIQQPKTTFDTYLTIDSNKFNKICKCLKNNSTYFKIKVDSNDVSFSGCDSNYDEKIKISNIKQYKLIPENISINHLLDFRSVNAINKYGKKLSNIYDIYLKNNFPPVFVISTGTMGKLYIFVSPITN